MPRSLLRSKVHRNLPISLKRTKLSRTRGPNPDAPENHPDADTPGWGKPLAKRLTLADLRGEHRIDMIRRAKECGRAAMTDFEVAEEFGVSIATLGRWMTADPVFAEALQLGSDLANNRVERALYHRAVGYSYRSEKIMTRSLPDGGSEIVRVPCIEHVPPDKTAMIFWLKNRRPDLWADVVDHNVRGSVDVNDAAQDPRTLAMALLAVMREAVEADREKDKDKEQITLEAAE